VAYGSHRRQRFDVYLPSRPVSGAPVIVMVHGGGWRNGDKAMPRMVENKVARWVPAGFVVISVNYRMVEDGVMPVEQARDVGRAVAEAQRRAASWGADPRRFVLMGHSAGAHLVTLLTTSSDVSSGLGLTPWLGVVSLDSGGLDVVEIMEGRHARLYDDAFGSDRSYWRAASPFHALARPTPPIHVVCSTQRPVPCQQAVRFSARATTVGTRTSVQRVDMAHNEINIQLGLPGAYTRTVEDFLRTLHPSLAAALDAAPWTPPAGRTRWRDRRSRAGTR
jgi:arylformamidase